MDADRRVLFFGDSFVAGVGDPTGRGWVGRVVAASFDAGLPLVAYNLGVRRETSLEVAARWVDEARPRMRAQASYGLVFGFGVNDTTVEDERLRVEPGAGLDALGRVLDGAEQLALPALVVGLPPAGEPAQDVRVAALSTAFAGVATARGVPFVDVFGSLCSNAPWTAEAAAGDGAHPGAGGYAALARLVLAGGWLEWLGAIPSYVSRP
ncbi:MAG: acyl-CoA thioesterase [Solirubrobacteraceae bacterium]|nr:acyl-CoA thioesterase [Solirubrobacteraceae bacterium]